MNPFSLKDKHIIITGASSGIGKQCAISCSAMGAKISLVGRDINRLEEVKKILNNPKHIAISQDLSIIESIGDVLKEIVLKNGKIDGIINSAGMEGTIPINLLTETKYLDFFRTNTISGFELSKHASKKANKSSTGLSIVFIASVMGMLGEPGKLAYCLSKGAIINGVKALALELASKQVRVNCISPGVVDTPMTQNMVSELPESSLESLKKAHPLGFGKPVDVANACIYLLSDASKWITGTNLIVDGGYSAK